MGNSTKSESRGILTRKYDGTFQEGDMVLKKTLPYLSDSRGKWNPNYEGPYVVKKAFSGGALVLTGMDKIELPNPMNADAVKRYYAWKKRIIKLNKSNRPLMKKWASKWVDTRKGNSGKIRDKKN